MFTPPSIFGFSSLVLGLCCGAVCLLCDRRRAPLSTLTRYSNGRLACPHAHASARFWLPDAIPGERPAHGGLVGPRRAVAFLVAALGTWLG